VVDAQREGVEGLTIRYVRCSGASPVVRLGVTPTEPHPNQIAHRPVRGRRRGARSTDCSPTPTGSPDDRSRSGMSVRPPIATNSMRDEPEQPRDPGDRAVSRSGQPSRRRSSTGSRSRWRRTTAGPPATTTADLGDEPLGKDGERADCQWHRRVGAVRRTATCPLRSMRNRSSPKPRASPCQRPSPLGPGPGVGRSSAIGTMGLPVGREGVEPPTSCASCNSAPPPATCGNAGICPLTCRNTSSSLLVVAHVFAPARGLAAASGRPGGRVPGSGAAGSEAAGNVSVSAREMAYRRWDR